MPPFIFSKLAKYAKKKEVQRKRETRKYENEIK
jgi:hypothetical protein